MVAINQTWADTLLDENTNYGNQIDNAVNLVAAAVRERQRNGGRYWPETNDSKSGVNYVTSDSYSITTGAVWAVLNNAMTADLFVIQDSLITHKIAAEFEGVVDFEGNVTIDPGTTLTLGDNTEVSDHVRFIYDFPTSTVVSPVPFSLRQQDDAGSVMDSLFVTCANGAATLTLAAGDFGSSGQAGHINVGRNSNATYPRPGYIMLEAKDGTDYFLWVDTTGDLRIDTSAPTTVDTGGDVVGTQL